MSEKLTTRTRSDGTVVARFNLELPLELVQKLETYRGETPRTGVIASALRNFFRSEDDLELACHYVTLLDDVALEASAYRAAVDDPPMSRVASSALREYVRNQVSENSGIRAKYEAALARLKKTASPVKLFPRKGSE